MVKFRHDAPIPDEGNIDDKMAAARHPARHDMPFAAIVTRREKLLAALIDKMFERFIKDLGSDIIQLSLTDGGLEYL